MYKKDITGTIGNTPLVELGSWSPVRDARIFAKLESANPSGSLKDRIAQAMLEQAETEGLLTPDRVLLEPTSGNMGIALALLAVRKGYRVRVVMPDNASPERSQLLRICGAEVAYSPGSLGSRGAIEVAQTMAAQDERYVMPFQYGNPANPEAHYRTTGSEIVQDLPEVTHFVAGLGTGGTLMGVGRRLKEHNPEVQIIAAMPQAGDQIPGLRNPYTGFVPPVLDLDCLDAAAEVSREESFRHTADLLSREAIFAGPSSGAVLAAALRVARTLDAGNIVCLLADDGWRYLSTDLWQHQYAGTSMT